VSVSDETFAAPRPMLPKGRAHPRCSRLFFRGPCRAPSSRSGYT